MSKKIGWRETLYFSQSFLFVKQNIVQVDLDIRGLFICEFAVSHFKNWYKMPNSWSKCAFLSANSIFAVQNSGTYLPRITRPTCTMFYLKTVLWCWDVNLHKLNVSWSWLNVLKLKKIWSDNELAKNMLVFVHNTRRYFLLHTPEIWKKIKFCNDCGMFVKNEKLHSVMVGMIFFYCKGHFV